MAFLVAVQGGQGAADVPSDRLQQLQLPGLEGFCFGLQQEHGAMVAGAIEKGDGQTALAGPGIADQDCGEGEGVVRTARAGRLAQRLQACGVARLAGVDGQAGAAEAQCAGTQSDEGFDVLQYLQQGVPCHRLLGQGMGGAVQELQRAVAAGQGLGLLLDPAFQLAVDPGQVFHHEVEGFAELSQLIGLPCRDAYVEVAALYDAGRGQQFAERAQHMALELEDSAGPEHQQQGQRHALDQPQPLQLGLQPFFHQGHQAVDAGHDPRGIPLQGTAGGCIGSAAEDRRPVVLAPFRPDLVVSLADRVGSGGGDDPQEVGMDVAAFELGQCLIQPGGLRRPLVESDR